MTTVEPKVATEITVDSTLDTAPHPEDAEEVEHLACCREVAGDGPVVAICGKIEDRSAVRAFSYDNVCEKCDELANQSTLKHIIDGAARNWHVCFRDGTSCPTGEELETILRKISGVD